MKIWAKCKMKYNKLNESLKNNCHTILTTELPVHNKLSAATAT